ncbi:metal-binding protein [endosymbiont 'TC1' of Trimyema compressum]|nr:cysteine-rich small domain-containing protein [endosymbiont 'TC1' of Trimyema compressum]AMP21434.1 metal-binding protein [endosymbiont 'TC1' of Trimyema compressum]
MYFEEWEYSYKFCQNKGCKYFPCHKVKNENKFSCLFCYCPLYRLENCGGNYSLLENDVKNCIKCTLPHAEKNYDYIMKKLSLNT